MFDHHEKKNGRKEKKERTPQFTNSQSPVIHLFLKNTICTLSLLFCIMIKCESNHSIGGAIKHQHKRGWSLKTQWKY